MTYAFIQDVPADREMYAKIRAKLPTAAPAGLITHVVIEQESGLRYVDVWATEMALTCDGATVSAGTGAACLGHPVNAVVWLANAVAERGDPLRAGEVILSGSLGPLVAVERGKTYEATFTGLGTVRAVFEPPL